ncbi:MAG TPA: alanine--tRNA ligase [Candidatus Saccharimonadales bacterium]|nr:alanine--tRNA ligase [Candidatus Saccharimonadales bacterium]
MNAQQIRQKYLEFFKDKGHAVLPRALLVPQDDPTTLFTGSGMQPIIPYLLGQPHPEGSRLTDSQTCFRAEDMDEVGDNRHTTFFEMLGNWSLGDYFKEDQLQWFYDFLTKTVGLDPAKLYVTCFIGDESNGVPKDTESAKIWKDLFDIDGVDHEEVEIGSEDDGYAKGMHGGRIFYYDATKNWWSRAGVPANMPDGEPGGPDSEVFYDFGTPHDEKFGKHCHPNCDCGRFLEIGNSVFMTYKKVGDKFEELPKPNVDFGGGLERIAAAAINSPDVFKISLLKPIIEGLEKLSGKEYEQHESSMRVIADHLRAAVFLAVDGVAPSNKQQGYVMRRLLRRAIRYAFELGIEQDLCEQVAPIIIDLYKADFPEVAENEAQVMEVFTREEKIFRQTLRKGLAEFKKLMAQTYTESFGIMVDESIDDFVDAEIRHQIPAKPLTGNVMFTLYDTYGFPIELTKEEAYKSEIPVADDADKVFEKLMEEQRRRSQTASAGMFKGGLADHSEQVVKYHTATHLMYQALKNVLGDHVVQRGSNITAERLRFDFSHPEKVTREQLDEVEKIVNEKIAEDLPVSWQEEKTAEAFKKGASGAFGDKYGDTVKVYAIGDPESPFSREICGGPHVEHTGVIGEGGKKFKITKEEASSAGVRRIKAVLQ